MVDMEGNIEEQDVDYIGQTIQNNGENISNSIDALTKELRMYNILKIMDYELEYSDKPISLDYKYWFKNIQKIIEDELR